MQRETVKSRDEVIAIYEKYYNEENQLLYKITYNNISSSNKVSFYSKEEYEYKNGLLTSEKKYSVNEKGKLKLSEKSEYKYNNDKLVSETQYLKSLTKDDLEILSKKEYTYYENGNTETYKYYSYISKSMYSCTTEKYIYNENNQLINTNVYVPENVFSGDDVLSSTYSYEYDEKGNNTVIIFENLKLAKENYRETLEYDDKGYETKRLQYKTINDGLDTLAVVRKATRIYDANHNILNNKIEDLSDDNTTYYVAREITNVFDSDNRIIKEDDYNCVKRAEKEIILEYISEYEYIIYE